MEYIEFIVMIIVGALCSTIFVGLCISIKSIITIIKNKSWERKVRKEIAKEMAKIY